MTATEHSAAVSRNLTADRMCRHLAAVAWGRAAREITADPAGLRGPHRVHVLPMFAWVRPADGAKADTGELHAIKVSWSGGPVRLVPAGEEIDVAWTATGLGLSLKGSTRLSAGSESAEASGPTSEHRSSPLAAPAVAERLRSLSDGAEIARWEALMLLDDLVRAMSPRSNRAVSMELTDGEIGEGVLDREQLEETVTTVVFGEGSRNGRMWTALDRVTDPGARLSVDPIHYLVTEARRSLSEGIRDQVGDPQIGPKIRRLARHLGIGTDLDTLIEEYRRLYPADKLGRARAIKALTSAPSIDATALRGLREEDER